ncbi:MAG: hypothetical protein V1790_18555 [Planctomycetota bacterium]
MKRGTRLWLFAFFGTVAPCTGVKAGPEACGTGGGPTICVRIDNLAVAPTAGVDYVFDFNADPTGPTVRLLVGQEPSGALYAWRVWSKDAQGAPANIGSITSPGEYNYSVKIANPDEGPGAANLNSASLTPAGDHCSSIASGSRMSGNLAGNLTLQKTSGWSGGTLSLTIDGDAEGDIIVPQVSSLDISGDALGRIEAVVLSPSLTIGGDLLGDIAVTGVMELATLTVNGNVAPDASIEIADTLGAVSITFGVEGTLGEFSGDMLLGTGVEASAVIKIYDTLTPVGQHIPTIDLNDWPVAGELLIPGGGSGIILDGGEITETVGLAENGAVFSGTATFLSAASGSDIKLCQADLNGTIHIREDADGQIGVAGNMAGGGRLLSNGVIQIDRDMGGTVTVFADVLGDIIVSRDVSSDGNVLVGGALEGNILVGGVFDGNLCVGDLSPSEPLPSRIQINLGPCARVCGQFASPGEIVWDSDPPSLDRTTRSLRFMVSPPCPATGTPGQDAIRVELVELQNPEPPNAGCCPPQNFGCWEAGVACGTVLAPVPPAVGVCTGTGETGGCARWVGKPATFYEAQGPPLSGPYRAARLQCSPFYADWVAETASGRITVVGAEIMPSSEYSVKTYGASCTGNEDACTNVSAAVPMYTRRSGDVETAYNPPGTGTQPDGSDATALVNKFKKLAGAPANSRSQVQPNLPELNTDVGATDVVAVVDAFKGLAYPYGGPCQCPSLVTCGPGEGSLACDPFPLPGGVATCRGSPLPGLGAESTCVKTCSGSGDPCISREHCPTGETCGSPFCRDRCGRCTPNP